MIIRSQDREKIVNFNNITKVEIENGRDGMNVWAYSSGIVSLLGTYSTEEKTIKVLDMIQETYMQYTALKNGLSGRMIIEIQNGTIQDTNNNLIETKEGITCGCENPELKMVYHIDGKDFYSYQYKCSCGNTISMSCKRSNEDEMW